MKRVTTLAEAIALDEYCLVDEELRTMDNRRVINVWYVPFNSVNERVTFPIKGCVVRGKKHPLYCIWRLDGRKSVFEVRDMDLNLKESSIEGK